MKILFSFILILNIAFAKDVAWRMGDRFISFEQDENDSLIYSSSCKKNKCQALNLVKELKNKKLPKNSTFGGKNPGAIICKELLKATVVYLKDLEGNENSFCFFNDKTMISNSSLLFLFKKNEKL